MVRAVDDILADIEKMGNATYNPPGTFYSLMRDLVEALDVSAGDLPVATNAQVYAGAADALLTAALITSASAFVTLTDAATVALSWTAGLNRTLTLGGDRTMQNPSGGIPGTIRHVRIIQDGTGNRTLAWGNQYKFPGGTAPTITIAAGSVDLVEILCVTASRFEVKITQDIR
jgi:hypothetical protein